MKEKDFMVAMKSVYFIPKENIAFSKYSKLLDFLSSVGGTSSVEDLPSNANMRGEQIKTELIATLGLYLHWGCNFLSN